MGITNQKVQVTNAAPMQYIEYGASFSSTNAKAANTPETIVSPASNVNGMIVWNAGFFALQTGIAMVSIVAKASAPANVNDGDVIAQWDSGGASSSYNYSTGSLKAPVKIPAGKGLYYIQSGTETNQHRHVLYTLL